MAEGNTIDRQTFLKGVISLSALAGAFSARELLAQEAEFMDTAARRAKADTITGRPYRVDDSVLSRFDESMVAINLAPRELGASNMELSMKHVLENYMTGRTSNIVDAGSRAAARSFMAAKFGLSTFSDLIGYYGTGRDNVGLLSYSPVSAPEMLCNMPPDLDDPAQLTTQAKTVAKLAGADLVGICKLDRRQVYSHSQRNPESAEPPVKKEIVFEKTEKPYETATRLVIPDSVENVIVMAVEQNRVMAQASPSMVTTCASSLGYSRMGIAVIMVAEYIRAMGYTAIPAMNGTGLSVPMAIDAGLGECGRNGLLITPEFGPNVRLCKVLTNMPLIPDEPIRFGVEQFCNECKKCARDCPSQAITHGAQSWSGYAHNNPGVYKWYNDHIKCIKFWHKSGTACMNCIAVCPFTKGEVIWGHDFIRWSIRNTPFLDKCMVALDDAFGYGRRREPSEMWERPVGTYGISADRFGEMAYKPKRRHT